ncbi:MAG: ABC transporter substrate-binding protein [Actinomycetota bacterium]
MKTRNPLLLACLLSLLIGLVAACGSDDTDDASTDSASASASASASDASTGEADDATGTEDASDAAATEDGEAEGDADGEAATRTVESLYGPVEVPVEPERVFVLDEYAGAAMVYSGVEPIAAFGTFRARIPLAILDESGVPITEVAFGDWPVEEVATAQPDMIVMTDIGDPSLPETLSEIAPTVVIPFIAPWQDIVAAVGDASGRDDIAATLDAAVTADLAALAEEPEAGSTFSVIASGPQFGTFSIAVGAVGSSVLEQAGYLRPEAQLAPPDLGVSLQLSPETLGEHDADFVLQLGGDESFYSVDELQSIPTFQGITAVADERTAVGLGEIWTSFDPFSVFWMVEDIKAIRAGDSPGTIDDLDTRWQAFLATTGG